MKDKRTVIKLTEFFYMIFWCIMLLAKGTGEWVFITLMGVICAYSYLQTKNLSILLCFAVLLGMKNVNISRIFRVSAVLWGSLMVFTIVRCFMGSQTDPILVHEKLVLGPIVRWSLGYTQPNVLHVTYAVFCAYILYVWTISGKQKRGIIAGLLFLGNI